MSRSRPSSRSWLQPRRLPGGAARRGRSAAPQCRAGGCGGSAGDRRDGVSAYLPVLAEDRQLDALATAESSPEELEEALADAELAHRLNPFAIEPLFTASSLASRAGDDATAAIAARGRVVQPDNWQPWRRLLTAYTVPAISRRPPRPIEEFVSTDRFSAA